MSDKSKLYLALEEVVVDRESECMAQLSDHGVKFSHEYNQRISALFNEMGQENDKRSIRTGLKVFVCLVAAGLTIGALGVVGGKVEQDWTIETNQNDDSYRGSTNYTFVTGDVDIGKVFANFEYMPKYIPKGFKLNEEQSYPDEGIFTYENGEKYFNIEIMPITTTLNIDNENFVKEKVDINGNDAYLFTNPKGDSCYLVWREATTIYRIHGCISTDEILKIARSFRRKN